MKHTTEKTGDSNKSIRDCTTAKDASGYLVCTTPWLSCLGEIEHVLNTIDREVMAGDAELSTLVVIIPMPCTHHALYKSP